MKNRWMGWLAAPLIVAAMCFGSGCGTTNCEHYWENCIGGTCVCSSGPETGAQCADPSTAGEDDPDNCEVICHWCEEEE